MKNEQRKMGSLKLLGKLLKSGSEERNVLLRFAAMQAWGEQKRDGTRF